jgi:hypothetical protein
MYQYSNNVLSPGAEAAVAGTDLAIETNMKKD